MPDDDTQTTPPTGRGTRRAPPPDVSQREKDDRQRNLFWDVLGFAGDHFWDFLILFCVLALVAVGLGRETMDKWFGKDTVDGVLNGAGSIFDKLKLMFAKMTGMDISGNLEAMPDAEFKTTLENNGVPPDAASFLTANRAPLLAIVKAANDGKIQVDSFTNPNTIFALMTKRPDMVLTLIQKMSAGAADPNGSMAGEIMTSLKTIVADENKLNELLNPRNRANTLKMLLAVKPDLAKQVDLAMLIDKGMENGKAIPELRALVSGALGSAEDFAKAQAAFITKIGPATALQIVKPEGLSADPAAQKLIAEVKAPGAIQALAALEKTLGKEQVGVMAAALMQPGADAKTVVTTMALQNPKALPEFIALANQLPSVKSAIGVDLGALHAVIQTVGMQADGRTPTPAMQQLFTAVSAALPKKPGDAFNYASVIPALTTVAVSPQLLGNPQAQAAVLQFAASIPADKIPEEQKAAFAFLKEHGAKTLVLLNELKTVLPPERVQTLLKGPVTPAALIPLLTTPEMLNSPKAQQALAGLMPAIAPLVPEANRAAFAQAQPFLGERAPQTFALLKAIGPQTATALVNTLLKDGATPTVFTALVLSPAVLERPEAQIALKELVAVIDPQSVPETQRAGFQQMQALLQADTPGTFALLNRLGREKSAAVFAALEKIDPAKPESQSEVTRLLLHPALIGELGAMTALAKQLPGGASMIPPSLEQFTQLVQVLGTTDGQINPAMKALLANIPTSGALTPELLTEKLAPAFPAFLTSPDVFAKITSPDAAVRDAARQIVTGYVAAAKPADIKDEAQRAAFAKIQPLLKDHSGLVFAALDKLGQAQSTVLMNLLLTGKEADRNALLARFALDEKNSAALPEMVALAAVIPGTDPAATAQIKQVATLVQLLREGGQSNAALNALIAKIPATGPLDATTLKPVLEALPDFLTDPKIFAKITTPGATQDALTALVTTLDVNALKDNKEQQAALVQLQSLLKGDAAPVYKLLAKLEPEGTKKLLAAMKSEDALFNFGVNLKYSSAMQEFAKTIVAQKTIFAQLPEKTRASLQQLSDLDPRRLSAIGKIEQNGVDAAALQARFVVTDEDGKPLRGPDGAPMLDPDKGIACVFKGPCRTEMGKAGLDNIATLINPDKATAMAKNLTALNGFAEKLAATYTGADPAALKTAQRVMTALRDMLVHGSMDGFNSLSAAELTSFFKNGKNAAAFRELVAAIDPSVIEAGTPSAKFLAALQTTYKNGKTGATELLNILADQSSVEAVLSQARGDTSILPAWATDFLAPLFTPSVISANADILPALKEFAKPKVMVAQK